METKVIEKWLEWLRNGYMTQREFEIMVEQRNWQDKAKKVLEQQKVFI